MRIDKIWIIAVLVLCTGDAWARNPKEPRTASKNPSVQYREVCANSLSNIDQEINNVRARLLGGGDCWWDFTNGRYIVPKVEGNADPVSALFAGSVWLGGVDPGNNLKLACQDFRSGATNEFWPGPLAVADGQTERTICSNWDRFFRVTGAEVEQHLTNLKEGRTAISDIPQSLRRWPAQGNPYFEDEMGFPIYYTDQGWAGFFDVNENGLYEPLGGDYPSIDIRGCPLDRYPDEMVFWIYNDQGGGAIHGNTKGRPIQMEVQVQAFGYTTNDELNDMTFQRYKLINRATERIDSMFFAMWTDPDLGCYADDYIGCDTSRDLMYVYNQDPTDGDPGTSCAGVPTYGFNVPILGVDYFRGPLDTFGNELGMSSFIYYNNPGFGDSDIPGRLDPNAPIEFYRYLTGSWRDGQPLTFGGNGYRSSNVLTKYAFSQPPNQAGAWSMCEANLPNGDRRTLQASGPFTLVPGAVNELIIGVPWVPDIEYPCPSLDDLFRADQLAQGLFDNCFDLLDGPTAPNADWIELNREVVAVLTNVAPSNNVNEAYAEVDPLAPTAIPEDKRSYKFEGYIIYQLATPNVSAADYDDPEKSRIVYQVDVRNNVTKLYNWTETVNPLTNKRYYVPELQVEGENKGIRHTFSISEDNFALGNNKSLINHKKYYYSVIAYGFNSYENFDPIATPAKGQQKPFLVGRKNIKIYTVIPRPVVDQSLQASYGDGVVVKRLEGTGSGGNFLDLDDATRNMLWQPNLKDTVLTYKLGRGPVNVTIFNPFEVKNGEYELALVDGNMNDAKLDDNARWELRKLPDGRVLKSESSIDRLNEQLVIEYGFTVTVAQPGEPGAQADERNGAAGAETVFADPNQQWLTGIPDAADGPFNFVKTSTGADRDNYLDPESALSTMGNGWFVPYPLCDWLIKFAPESRGRLLTPAWTESTQFGAGSIADRGGQNSSALTTRTVEGENVIDKDFDKRASLLANMPNVDIIFTSDTSKWSRCMVVESAAHYYTSPASGTGSFPKDPSLRTESPNNRQRVMFDVRSAPSVGKVDANNDGVPDPDGAKDQNGNPLVGMGWFPGYAIDVETGTRLNIFFGENSCYSKTVDPGFTGRDMLWNPTDERARRRRPDNLPFDYYDFVAGGQHWVYVMNTPYDRCEAARRRFTPEGLADPALFKVTQVRNISWAGMLMLNQGFRMKPLREGLIPNEVTVKLRVNNRYQTWYTESGAPVKRSGHPKYQFKIEERESKTLDAVQIENALDSVKMVPNPYYGFSDYENSEFSNVVKITNLPGKCTVTIYSLDGKFIKQYNRDEQYSRYNQISPAIEWDLKNNKGIPIASGVYLIHVNAPGLGERTLKWFGVARQFDPSRL
jgi:hypothetical protein